MKRIIRLTESDLTRIVRRVLSEQTFNRKEIIDTICDVSDFTRKELKDMSNEELIELYDSLEIDDWFDELSRDDENIY
jgi:hypothetical protein